MTPPPRGGASRPSAGPPAWAAAGVTFAYPGAARPAIDDLSLEIPAGSFTALLGPNGSGKSTLLRLLLGVLKPASGRVSLQGQPIGDWTRRDLAHTIGVVPQDEEISFPLTVRELVAMGRYARLGPFRAEGRADVAAVEAAMARCDVAGLGDRPIQSLSGGERQRARLARALAQEPRILALDEPTRALDMRHEMQILELLRGLVAEGASVLLVTHNLNLAARYADALLLLDRGRAIARGSPAEVLRRERIEAIYRWPVTVTPYPGPGPDAGAPQVTPVAPGERSTNVIHDPASGEAAS